MVEKSVVIPIAFFTLITGTINGQVSLPNTLQTQRPKILRKTAGHAQTDLCKQVPGRRAWHMPLVARTWG